jgi:hypothetical protein
LWIVVAQPASESANNAEQTKTNHPRFPGLLSP